MAIGKLVKVLQRRVRRRRWAPTVTSGREFKGKQPSISTGRMLWIEGATILVALVPVWIWMHHRNGSTGEEVTEHGRYLAQIGVCAACHTPPALGADGGRATELGRETKLRYRTDPDWFAYLDHSREMSGGVPFIIRISDKINGVVYSRNISPDRTTGIGAWTDEQVIRALREGVRPDGTTLFLFAPHSFFKDMSYNDAAALTAYLRTLPPVRNEVANRDLPFDPPSATGVTALVEAPEGQTRRRAEYLLDALVGCAECHSHHNQEGTLVKFAGGDRSDPYIGVFRLGPDLPLHQADRGFAAFPYPGYAVIYGGNLTRFGKGGDLADVKTDAIVDAVRAGVSTQPDAYGRPRPLGHVMLWQFYRQMSDGDAYAIANYVKSLDYIPHSVPTGPILFGEDWAAAFRHVFGQPPSESDRRAFGK
jgi:hypothetical protein